MNSVLGLISPGNWELGQDQLAPVTAGSFTATAFPSAKASGIGGSRIYTSVLGTVELGVFQVGQVPPAGVLSGKGSFFGSAFPSCVATA